MLPRGFQVQWGGLGEDVNVGSRGVLEGPRSDETTQEAREEEKLVLFPGNCCDRVPKLVKVKVLVVYLGPALCDPVHCSLSDSSVHGILQARILEWIAISSSRGSSQPRDRTLISSVSCIGRQILYQRCHRAVSRVV